MNHRNETGSLYRGDPTPRTGNYLYLLSQTYSLGSMMVGFIMVFILFLVIKTVFGIETGFFTGAAAITLWFMTIIMLVAPMIIYFKDKGKPEQESVFYTKVFSDRIGMVQYCGLWNRINQIKIDQVSDVHLDAMEYLKRNGSKLPKKYKPFMDIAPSSKKDPGILLSAECPLKYLVRIEMKEKVPILNWDFNSYSLFKGDMVIRDRTYWVENVLLPVRPGMQKEFKKEILRNRDKLNRKKRMNN